jgi:hypothetical protein
MQSPSRTRAEPLLDRIEDDNRDGASFPEWWDQWAASLRHGRPRGFKEPEGDFAAATYEEAVRSALGDRVSSTYTLGSLAHRTTFESWPGLGPTSLNITLLDARAHERMLHTGQSFPTLPPKGAIYFVRAKYLRSQEELLEIFNGAAEEWERATLVVSSTSQAISHPKYRRIIGLGLQAVPLLLERLQETGRYWFPALAAITGENPAQDVDTVPGAIDAWVEWGWQNGYLPVE